MIFEKNHEKVSELQSFREISKILKNHQNHEKVSKNDQKAAKMGSIWAIFGTFSMIIRRCLGGFFRGGVPELQEKIMKKCRSFRASKPPKTFKIQGSVLCLQNDPCARKNHFLKIGVRRSQVRRSKETHT
jgi:hypothetical protein